MSGSKNNKGEGVHTEESRSAAASTEEISRRLRALYDSVSSEAIPDRFLDLLERLDAVDNSDKDKARE